MVKPMVEKSPISLSDLTRCRRSWISGTENVVLRVRPARALPDVNQPVFVAIHQRPQKNAADQGEDSGIGSDSERQREDHCNRKPFRFG
jgi:hypothetical protein